MQRGEFLTSYTPYQAEFAQGTLTAIFEFQTLMAQLTGQEVANASMYDGSTALTEAVLMAERLTGSAPCSRRAHACIRNTEQVLATYAKNLGIEIEEIGYTPSGQMDRSALTSRKTSRGVAAVVVQSPNFFGVLEELPRSPKLRTQQGRCSSCDRGSRLAGHCAATCRSRHRGDGRSEHSEFRRATAARMSA